MDDLTLHWKFPPHFCFTCNRSQKESQHHKTIFVSIMIDFACRVCGLCLFLFFFLRVFKKKSAKIFSTFWLGTGKPQIDLVRKFKRNQQEFIFSSQIVRYKSNTHGHSPILILFDFLFILFTNLFVPCLFFCSIRSKPITPPISLPPPHVLPDSRRLLRMLLPFVYGTHRLLPTS